GQGADDGNVVALEVEGPGDVNVAGEGARGLDGGAAGDLQGASRVGHGAGATRAGADVIALDEVADGRGAVGVDAVAGVAAHDVGGCCGDAADGVGGGAGEQHAVAAVGQGRGARGVGPDEVALHRVAALDGAARVVDELDFCRGEAPVVDRQF